MKTEIVIHKPFVDGAHVLRWYDRHTTIARPAAVAKWSHLEGRRITIVHVVSTTGHSIRHPKHTSGKTVITPEASTRDEALVTACPCRLCGRCVRSIHGSTK